MSQSNNQASKRKADQEQHYDMPDQSKRPHLDEQDETQGTTLSDHDQEAQSATSSAGLELVEDSRTRKVFNSMKLPRELRDILYGHLTQHIAFAHGCGRDPDGLNSNCWEIGYAHAPSLSMLLLSKQVNKEYKEIVPGKTQVIVRLLIDGDDVSSDAPWFSSLPQWVVNNVRGVRLAVGLHDASAFAQRFTANELYGCFQKIMSDAATTLPEVTMLDVMLAYPWINGLEMLNNDITHRNVDMQRLLRTRPAANTHVQDVKFGVLLETDLHAYRIDHWLDSHPHSGAMDNYWDLCKKDIEMVGWYGTLSDRQPPRSYLGLDWQFVRVMNKHDLGDDEDGSVEWSDDRVKEDFDENMSESSSEYWDASSMSSNCSGDEDGSDAHSMEQHFEQYREWRARRRPDDLVSRPHPSSGRPHLCDLSCRTEASRRRIGRIPLRGHCIVQ